MNSMTKRFGTTVAALAMMTAGAHAADVEVLHWWTSGGEAAALNVLKEDLESQGVGWQDMPVAGGGGTQAMTVLRARVTSGNAPTAVQMLGFDITDWAKEGALANLNDIASAEGWDEVPEALQKFSKYDGKWVAAPVNVHSTNWVWANKAVLDELGIAPPTTWDELRRTAMEKVKAAGKVAVAHGGQAWQDATIFDAVAMSTGGPEFYKKAFIDLDTGHSRLGHDEGSVRPHDRRCAVSSTTTSRAATGTWPRRWSSTAMPDSR
jgi:glucose/mannose transport system substrate-binding protein